MMHFPFTEARKKREYVVIYIQPEKKTLLEKLSNAILRVIRVLYNPFTTYDEIAKTPDKLGPILAIVLTVIFQSLSTILVLNRVCLLLGEGELLGNYTAEAGDKYIRVYFVNATAFNKFKFLDIGQNIIALQALLFSVNLIFAWIILYFTNYLVSKLFGSTASSGYSAVGYVLSARMLGSLIDLIVKSIVVIHVPELEVVVPYGASIWKYNYYVKLSINEWMKYFPLELGQITTAIYTFVVLWGLVLNIAFCLSITKLSGAKGFAAGILAYIAYIILSTLIFPFLYI